MALLQRSNTVCTPFKASRSCRTVRVVCASQKPGQVETTRREFVLNSVNVTVLGALFTWGAADRPKTLGIQTYGRDVKTLGLCPPTPNCISTAEEINDPEHYVPAWTYNPEDGRGFRKPATKQQAMSELIDVVSGIKPDNWTPKVVKQTDDYLYVEFQSPFFGFIDDVEFYFPPGNKSVVEYRSASRVGSNDGNINRKRIKAIRKALERKGWASTGY